MFEAPGCEPRPTLKESDARAPGTSSKNLGACDSGPGASFFPVFRRGFPCLQEPKVQMPKPPIHAKCFGTRYPKINQITPRSLCGILPCPPPKERRSKRKRPTPPVLFSCPSAFLVCFFFLYFSLSGRRHLRVCERPAGDALLAAPLGHGRPGHRGAGASEPSPSGWPGWVAPRFCFWGGGHAKILVSFFLGLPFKTTKKNTGTRQKAIYGVNLQSLRIGREWGQWKEPEWDSLKGNHQLDGL